MNAAFGPTSSIAPTAQARADSRTQGKKQLTDLVGQAAAEEIENLTAYGFEGNLKGI